MRPKGAPLRPIVARSEGTAVEGNLEVLTSRLMSGWVWCTDAADQAAIVSAKLAGVTLFRVRAHTFRADLAPFGKRQGACGFVAPVSTTALADAKRRLQRSGARAPTLDLSVHPVVHSKIRAPRIWQRLTFNEYSKLLEEGGDGAIDLRGDANPFVGMIRRTDQQVISGWCATVCPDERRSRVPVALYVDGVWADTQFAKVPLLGSQVAARRAQNALSRAGVQLRFRFRTPRWARDGREHEISVALAGRPDWLIDEPRFVMLDEDGAHDPFAMPALYPTQAASVPVTDGPARGEYEAWIRDRRARPSVSPRHNKSAPTISVFVESRLNTTPAELDETLASLRARSVNAADVHVFGPGTGDDRVTLRKAVTEAKTEYWAACRAGDRIAVRALERLAEAAVGAPHAAIIFGDDDRRDVTGRRRQPRLKTRYCPDRALTDTLFDGLTMVRADEARAAMADGPPPSDTRSLFLKVARRAGADRVVHTPTILCHRVLEAPHRPGFLNDKHTAFLTALLDQEASAVDRQAPRVEGVETARVLWPMPDARPTVSVIIPTRDGAHMFEPLIDELIQDGRNSGISLDIVLMDNGSVSPVTHASFARLEEKGGRVVKFDRPFNYAAICNAGAAAATGDILLFMNDDLVGLGAGLIDEMVRHAVRPDVGVVGARLSYPDGTNQHCGIGIGVGGVASHLHKGHGHLGHADYGRFRHVQTVSAVTAALMAVRRDVFDAAGGFEEALSVAYNDVDFCLRVTHALGLRVVYTPHARAYHLESQTRGLDLTAEKRARLGWETSYMRVRWGTVLDRDPYVSPNRFPEHRADRPSMANEPQSVASVIAAE